MDLVLMSDTQEHVRDAPNGHGIYCYADKSN